LKGGAVPFRGRPSRWPPRCLRPGRHVGWQVCKLEAGRCWREFGASSLPFPPALAVQAALHGTSTARWARRAAAGTAAAGAAGQPARITYPATATTRSAKTKRSFIFAALSLPAADKGQTDACGGDRLACAGAQARRRPETSSEKRARLRDGSGCSNASGMSAASTQGNLRRPPDLPHYLPSGCAGV